MRSQLLPLPLPLTLTLTRRPQLLLNARADTSLKDRREHDCALTTASKLEEYDCLLALLAAGADPEADDSDGERSYGRTAKGFRRAGERAGLHTRP